MRINRLQKFSKLIPPSGTSPPFLMPQFGGGKQGWWKMMAVVLPEVWRGAWLVALQEVWRGAWLVVLPEVWRGVSLVGLPEV